MQKVEIVFSDYCYTCGDGCCTSYGTVTTVNGVELPTHNQDLDTILTNVLKHLGYDVHLIHRDEDGQI